MFELIPFDHHMRRISAFDPFRAMDDMERSFFGDGDMTSAFRTDVSDTGDAYLLEAELPGFRKEEIKLDVQDDCLTISAEHSEEKEDKDEKNQRYLMHERYYGAYSRIFDVSGIDVDGIEASYNDGVLTINMPKKAEAVTAVKRLEIK